MDNWILLNSIISVSFVLFGFLIKLYLRRYKLNNMRKVLSFSAFYLKFSANVLIVFGALAFIASVVALFIGLFI